MRHRWAAITLGMASWLAACGPGRSASESADASSTRGVDPDASRSDAAAHRDAADAARSRDGAIDGAALAISASCAAMLQPPTSLACTGLYANLATKTVSPELRTYAPAVPLWADGSGKLRWIYLPPGQTIDRSNPSDWTFPVGTRVWKEFSRDGIRVETRFFEKLSADFWAYGTYQWSADETSATLAAGGDLTLPNGDTYHVPTLSECAMCHSGRPDKLMGFEEVSLGLSGATGLTLDVLAKEQLLSPAPSRTQLTVGDDGTGLAAAPLSWLHVNCGVSCHNTDSTATASALGMVLRLDPAELDGRPSTGFASLATTRGVSAHSAPGVLRIDPGSPDKSLLHELIDERGSVQMPPIASLLVDKPDVAAVAAWIAAMPSQSPADAGTDAGRDGGRDAAQDAEHDAAHDAERDAARDAERDAERDATRDAERDATPDAAHDAARDATPDAAHDAARDAARDAAKDAGQRAQDAKTDADDAARDVEQEAARDAGRDAPADVASQ